jgi:hypothetical protein
MTSITIKVYIEYLIKKLNKTSFKSFQDSEFYSNLPRTLETNELLILWDNICLHNDSSIELLNLINLLQSKKFKYINIYKSLNMEYVYLDDPIYTDLLYCLLSLTLILHQNLYKGDNIYLENVIVLNTQFNIKEFIKYLEELKLNLSSEIYSTYYIIDIFKIK